ncbi:unnamed protein product [Dicrocoelium dendriticum]|nr:unnamed protein product [Dicrocoelium dendriticum]
MHSSPAYLLLVTSRTQPCQITKAKRPDSFVFTYLLRLRAVRHIYRWETPQLLFSVASNSLIASSRDALHQFEDLSNSWRRSKHRNDQLFLAVIDFDRSPDVFEKLKLNKAPSIVHIGPHGVVSPSDHMNVEQLGYSAEAIASWIAERTSIRIYVVRPPSYAWIMLLAIFLTAGVALLWFKRIDVSYFTNPALWCVLSLGVIFCGISGQVYNQIRGPPLLHATPNGEIVSSLKFWQFQKAFIYPGSDYQFVAETIIVIFLYVLATVGILFIHQVDGTVEAGRKKILISAGLVLFSVAFSLVLSVFRKKYHGYPYRYAFLCAVTAFFSFLF